MNNYLFKKSKESYISLYSLSKDMIYSPRKPILYRQSQIKRTKPFLRRMFDISKGYGYINNIKLCNISLLHKMYTLSRYNKNVCGEESLLSMSSNIIFSSKIGRFIIII